jgi:hypothetical protein
MFDRTKLKDSGDEDLKECLWSKRLLKNAVKASDEVVLSELALHCPNTSSPSIKPLLKFC